MCRSRGKKATQRGSAGTRNVLEKVDKMRPKSDGVLVLN